MMREHLSLYSFIRCKKYDNLSKTHCIFCNYAVYYACIIMTEVRVCTELLWKNY